GRVRALLDVDREREEVEAFPRVLADARGGQEHGVLVQVGGDGALRLLREAAGLEADDALAELAVVDDGFGELDLGTLQGVPSSLSCWSLCRTARSWPARMSGQGTGRKRVLAQCRNRLWSTVETRRSHPSGEPPP